MQKTARQGGSTAVFVVFGIVLIVLALSSIYGVRRLAMNDQTPPLVVPEETEDAGNDQSQGAKDEADEQPEVPVEEEKTKEHKEVAEEETTSPPAVDQEVSPPATPPAATGGTGSTGLPSTGGSSGASNAGPEKLPQSGPEEAIMSIFAVTFISIAGLAYIKSRRALQ